MSCLERTHTHTHKSITKQGEQKKTPVPEELLLLEAFHALRLVLGSCSWKARIRDAQTFGARH